MKKFLTKVTNLCRSCPRCRCLSSVLYRYGTLVIKNNEETSIRNQDFQTNSAHLITMDRKMIPTDPRTNRETQSVHHFIYNVPQLPSLWSNTGGRWQKIVTCDNNLSQQPTTPIHSQQNLSIVHIHHVNPHWGQALRFARRCWLNYAEHVPKNIWSNILSQSEKRYRSKLPWIFPLDEMIQCM